MSRRWCFVLALLILALGAGSSRLAAQQISALCYYEGREAVCDVRPGQAKQVSDITAKVDGKAIQGTSYEPFDRSSRTAAWYFLIQQTANPRDSAQVVDRITQQGGSRRLFGIGTFSDKFEERAALGATPGDIARFKEQRSFKAGDRTDLFRSAQDGIEKLTAAGIKADRKALVLFADGRADFGQSGRDRLIKAMNDKNILLYTVFMASKSDQGADARQLEDLKTDAGGVWLKATDCSAKARREGLCSDVELEESAVRDFFFYLERGGQLRFPASAVSKSSELTFTVAFADGTTAQSKPVTLGTNPDFKTEPEPGVLDRAKDFVMDNPLIAGGGAVLALGILMLAAATLSRRPPAASEAYGRTEISPIAFGETVILTPRLNPNPEHVYAWLQFLDADARRVPIDATNVRIGRHGDNDIVLQNKTVHRQHAFLHMTPDKHFTINDLGGENGTVVNGQKCSQRDLNDGDLIELGEVRLRFFSNM